MFSARKIVNSELPNRFLRHQNLFNVIDATVRRDPILIFLDFSPELSVEHFNRFKSNIHEMTVWEDTIPIRYETVAMPSHGTVQSITHYVESLTVED